MNKPVPASVPMSKRVSPLRTYITIPPRDVTAEVHRQNQIRRIFTHTVECGGTILDSTRLEYWKESDGTKTLRVIPQWKCSNCGHSVDKYQ